MQTVEYDIVTEAEEQFNLVYPSTYVNVYANQHYVYVKFRGSNLATSTTAKQLTTIPRDYAPSETVFCDVAESTAHVSKCYIYGNGVVYIRSDTSITLNFGGSVMYPRISALP